MDIPAGRLLRLLLPRLPSFITTYLLNKLSLSPNSDKQDARTEVAVAVIRAVLSGRPRPMNVIQSASLKGPAIKGNMWISMATAPASDAAVRELVIRAIKELGDGTENYILPDVVDVEGEWTGYRADVDKKAPRPEISEQEQYDSLMKEVTSEVTILYFHGGAYFMMDPSTHRLSTARLARKTGGRCFSVRYRLAPQAPFPAALLDALTTYLYLLAPPKGSFHKPVKASNIIFAGDSAGGNLAAVLGLLLLTLQKAGVKTIPFHGQDVPVELPGGMGLNSPWCDIRRTLPSIQSNAKYDYLDPPSATGLPKVQMPEDDVWPSSPPRAEIFCQASLLTHPLVSPLLATAEMWEGICPVYICGGTEGLEDEFTVLGRRLYQAGASVDFVNYSGQPHCFAMIFPNSPAGNDCFDSWAEFMTKAVNGQTVRIDTGRRMLPFTNPVAFEKIDLSSMGLSDEDVTAKTQAAKRVAIEQEQEQVKRWEMHQSKAKL